MIDVFTQDFYILFFDSNLECTRRSFLKTRISGQNRNRFRTYFSLFIRGPEKIMSYNGGWKYRDTLPLTQSWAAWNLQRKEESVSSSTLHPCCTLCTEFQIKRKYWIFYSSNVMLLFHEAVVCKFYYAQNKLVLSLPFISFKKPVSPDF